MAIATQTVGPTIGTGTRNGVQASVIGGRIYLRSAGAIRTSPRTRSATSWGTSAYWSAQWSALTTIQRAAWTAYGLAYRQRPMKGWSGFTSGRASFSGFNFANRWLGSSVQINTPPALPCTMPDPVPRVAPFLVPSSTGYLFQLLDPVPIGFNVIIGAFAPTMTNSRPDLASCQRIATMPGPLDAGTLGPLLADYEAAFGTTPAGSKQWYRFWLECDNQTASMGDACGALVPGPIPPAPGTVAWAFLIAFTYPVTPITVEVTIDGTTYPPMTTDYDSLWAFECDSSQPEPVINAMYANQLIDGAPFDTGTVFIEVSASTVTPPAQMQFQVQSFIYDAQLGWQLGTNWGDPLQNYQAETSWLWTA